MKTKDFMNIIDLIDSDAILVRSSDQKAYKYFLKIWGRLLEEKDILINNFLPFYQKWFDCMKNRTGWYHSWGHLIDIFCEIKENHDHIHDITSMIWATLFHDAIYKPGSKSNEEESAKLMRICLYQFLSTSNLDHIESLILATKQHQQNEWIHSEWKNSDLKLFVDIDFSVLAFNPSRYNLYLLGIDEEFKKYPSIFFSKIRKRWIQNILARKNIYVTEFYRNKCEIIARKNLKNELENAWTLFGYCRGIYDPAENRMHHYLIARKIFETQRKRLLESSNGCYALVNQEKIVGIFSENSIINRVGYDWDLVFEFEIISVEDENIRIKEMFPNVYSALIQPFLDTNIPEAQYNAIQALTLRGAPYWMIKILHFIVGTGAWVNMFVWEWVYIPFGQFKRWLLLNVVIMTIMSFALGLNFWGGVFACVWSLLTLISLHLSNYWLFGNFKIED